MTSERDVDAKTVIDLRAFANHLRATGAQITATQVDHALDLVERAKTERAKIVALVKSRQEGWRHDNREIGQALEDLAWAIENDEHLKEGVGHGS